MQPRGVVLVAATVLFLASTAAFSDAQEKVDFDPMKMWSCPLPDGTVLYTNKEKAGCTPMTLKPLSIVPSLDDMPTYRPPVAAVPQYEIPPYGDRRSTGPAGRQAIPDWGQQWYASIAPSGPAQEEVCGMYGEWLNLNQKTRGGFFFGTDPSYGGDVSGRNRWAPSFSFNDNVRYHALARIFGTGFVPVGCP